MSALSVTRELRKAVHCVLFAHLENGDNSTHLTVLFMKIE